MECQGKAISDEKEAPLKSLCENSISKLSPAEPAELQSCPCETKFVDPRFSHIRSRRGLCPMRYALAAAAGVLTVFSFSSDV